MAEVLREAETTRDHQTRTPVSVLSLSIGVILTVLATNAGSYARFILHATWIKITCQWRLSCP